MKFLILIIVSTPFAVIAENIPEPEVRKILERIAKEKKEGAIARPSLRRSKRNLEKIRAAKKKGEEIDKLLEADQKAHEKKYGFKAKPKKRVKVRGWKPKDDDYVPEEEEKPKPKPRRNPRRKVRNKARK